MVITGGTKGWGSTGQPRPQAAPSPGSPPPQAVWPGCPACKVCARSVPTWGFVTTKYQVIAWRPPLFSSQGCRSRCERLRTVHWWRADPRGDRRVSSGCRPTWTDAPTRHETWVPVGSSLPMSGAQAVLLQENFYVRSIVYVLCKGHLVTN